MREAEFKEILRDATDEELSHKLKVGDGLCEMLAAEKDETARAAMRELRKQQGWIMDVQAERVAAVRERNGEAEPEAMVVGLQPLVLTGRAVG